MKKIVTFIILMCMALTFAACTDNASTTSTSTTSTSTTSASTTSTSTASTSTTSASTASTSTTSTTATPGSTASTSTTSTTATPGSTTPGITLQEVYDAGKNIVALLGDHENVHIVISSKGNVISEEYLSKKYYYSYQSPEFMDMGFEYAGLTTENSEYVYFDNIYILNVTLTPSGMIDMKDRFATVKTAPFISSEVLNDSAASIVEKDGSIIVTCTADPDEIVIIGEDIVSCVETYTLDAKTHEMTSVKTVYTYNDGTVEEGIATITRDVEMPEIMKKFVAYDQETENMRTVTIVSNPGTENEKTESVKAAKGMLVGFSPDWDVEGSFNLYLDAECTQLIEEEPDLNADITIYVKWDE